MDEEITSYQPTIQCLTPMIQTASMTPEVETSQLHAGEAMGDMSPMSPANHTRQLISNLADEVKGS